MRGSTLGPEGATLQESLSSGRFACDDVTVAPQVALTDIDRERHAILALLAMALVFDHWGVNRSRPEQVVAYAEAEPGRAFADYLGHNVGALLVAPDGAIVGFALNRNVALNSTLEHAELRVIRDAIDAANAAAGPAGIVPWSFGTLLQAHNVYVTLEPCSQCCGTMDLARIGSVVFAQPDPGQCDVVTALYNLHRRPGALAAPLPVRADFLPFWNELEQSFGQYVDNLPTGGRKGITSFLETVPAYRIYAKAAAAFESLSAAQPGNDRILANARRFRADWRDS